MWLILLIAVVTLTFAYIKWKYTYWSRRGVPSPKTSFVFGNIASTLNFKEHLGTLIVNWYNEFPDVPYFGYYKFLEPAIVLRDPDLIKDILTKDNLSFHLNDMNFDEKADPLLTWNPFTCGGEKWKQGRSMLAPLFTASKLKSIFSEMLPSCESLVRHIKTKPTGADFEAKALSHKYATENIVKCTFSIDAKCFDENGTCEFSEISNEMFNPSRTLAFKFLLMPLFPKWISSLIPTSVLSKKADVWFRDLLAENKQSRKNIQLAKNDFVQLIINLGQKNNACDEEMAGHSLSVYLEGSETTSQVMGFVLYDLARNPEVQERVYGEIQNVLAKHDKNISFEAVQEMNYLDCVIHETMRLDSVSMLLPKLCTQTYTLPRFGAQKEGVTIYPGTTILIPTRAIHMDPNYYPNPDEFRPERFTDEERKSRHKAHYLAFGEGPRMCVGMRLGLTQVKVAIVSILKEFKISVSANHKPFERDTKAFMWHAKNGLMLNFEQR